MYRSYREPTDLHSAVEVLEEKFRDMSWDAGHESIYGNGWMDLNYLQQLQETFNMAEDLCRGYLDNKISIHEFCEAIAAQDLTSYLFSVRMFLPFDIIVKYHLFKLEIESDEEKPTYDKQHDGDHQPVINMFNVQTDKKKEL